MATAISEAFREKLLLVIEEGDEAKARAFVVENIKEFPQETQDAIIAGLVEEALITEQDQDNLLLDLRGKAIEATNALAEGTKILEKESKLAEIREDIQGSG